MFNGIGTTIDDRFTDISRTEYPNGYTLYIIQLCPGEPDGMTFDLVQNGSVRLEMKFKTAVVETLTALVYAEYDNLLEIDRDRSVILDY